MNPDSINFINKNKHKTVNEIALLLSKKNELDKEFIINQINGLQKAKNKLPEFYHTKNIIFPSTLAMEQCSSEKTAIHKSNILKGTTLLDFTGGFGVDSYYFSKKFSAVTYVEPNANLFKIAANNFKNLKAINIKTINASAEHFITKFTKKVDVVYIDPSRRKDNAKVFNLKDCVPDITKLIDNIFKISDKILIKTSPFLDVKQSIKELKFVSKIFIIAVNNDCKEVLYLLEKNTNKNIITTTVNLAKTNQIFKFILAHEKESKSTFSLPKKYLYEPNVAVLKSGGFNIISNVFKINKLAKNSHLYTSNELISDFPGRILSVQNVLNYNTKEFKKLGIKQANITCRNFVNKPSEVKEKLKLKDGGSTYLFATKDFNEKPILISCMLI